MNKQVKAFFDQIKAVEAVYTGGGIWVFVGELLDGSFFMHDDNYATEILSEYPDPEKEEVWFWEWQQPRIIRELDIESEGPAFQLALLEFIRRNNTQPWDDDFSYIEKEAKSLLGKRGWF